jgi:processive 1,2-diacylglycerol beta-glucosyltransferase
MEKVLLLSASTGGGHNSAAKAIKDSLEKLDCEVSVVDTLKFVSPMLDKIVSSGYEKSAKYVPKTYGAIYKISSRKTNKEELDVFVRRVLGRKVLRLIEDTKPGAIVGTHPFPIMALMKYKEQGTINIPVISVLTDYSIHPAHVQENIDAYIAGDDDVGYLLRNAGVEKEKIYPLGIPISSNFLSTDRVDIVRHQLGLEDKFTVLLMGGSFGAGNMKDCFLDLINSKYNFQIAFFHL